jgi:phage terminase large subunit GpA-like protein
LHGEEATEFYRANRAAMDEGASIAWPERFNHDELSAIQHAMNLKLQDEAAFFAEYQNEPLPADAADRRRTHGRPDRRQAQPPARGEVPIGCSHLTMFVDVQATLLFYVVAAWEDDFTGYVIDYGTFPDQKRPYFTLRDARLTLSMATKASGLEGSDLRRPRPLTGDHTWNREWRRDDGAMLRIERCLIDANWGSSTDVVYQFCRQSAHAGIVMPSHGRFVGASSQPFSEYKRRPGDRIGHNWRMPNVPASGPCGTWSSTRTTGSRSCMPAGGADGRSRVPVAVWRQARPASLLAEHLTSEYRVKTEGRGRTVDEWKLRPERGDNHWLDCLVGCAVAASMQGAVLAGTGGSAALPCARERLSFANLQRSRRR